MEDQLYKQEAEYIKCVVYNKLHHKDLIAKFGETQIAVFEKNEHLQKLITDLKIEEQDTERAQRIELSERANSLAMKAYEKLDEILDLPVQGSTGPEIGALKDAVKMMIDLHNVEARSYLSQRGRNKADKEANKTTGEVVFKVAYPDPLEENND